MLKTETSLSEETKQGFTIIEVMLVLAITGLMLMGVIAGTYSSIATQRYNDSVRSFSEFLRQIYAEVINPQSLGEGNSDEKAIYGKIAVFGLDESDASTNEDIVYTATLVGKTDPPLDASEFISELNTIEAGVFCGDGGSHASTVSSYTPMWQALIETPNETATSNIPLKGTLIIARSPASGVVHTAFTPETYNIKTNCNTASQKLTNDLKNNPSSFKNTKVLDFCIVSDNSAIVRDIRLNVAEGHNSSAINLLPVDETEDGVKALCSQK